MPPLNWLTQLNAISNRRRPLNRQNHSKTERASAPAANVRFGSQAALFRHSSLMSAYGRIADGQKVISWWLQFEHAGMSALIESGHSNTWKLKFLTGS
jgi:hypothetical protein